MVARTDLPPGWYNAATLARRIADWRAVPRPELATDRDLRLARAEPCPACGARCAGVTVLDRGPGWRAWRLATCPDCEIYGDMACW